MPGSIEGKTVLVTGAGGFVGPAVVDALVGGGAFVRALIGPPGQISPRFPSGVKIFTSDIGELLSLCDFTSGCDVVVHMAGGASVSESFEKPVEYARAHVVGTATILEACRRTGINRIVYVSSAEVYGRPKTNPVKEDHPVQPRSPYAATKVGAEQFVEAFVHTAGMRAVVLRPFSIYGPGVSDRSLVGTILKGALERDSIVLADLNPVRDFCYLDDFARAVVLASMRQTPGYSVMNIGTGQGTSVMELAKMVLEIMGRDIPIREDRGMRRPEHSEISELIADPGRALDLLGWRSTVKLRSGLELLLRMRMVS